MCLRIPVLALLFFVLSTALFSQNPFDTAIDHIKRTGKYGNLDLTDVIVTDQYQTKHNGLIHLYLRQRLDGIEIDGANINYNILDDGSIASFGGQFYKNIDQKISSTNPTFSQKQVLQYALSELGIENNLPLEIIESHGGNDQKVVFDKGDISLENISVRLIYVPVDEKLKLAWELSVYEKSADNWWLIALDALTGEVLQKHNYVLHCDFGEGFQFITNQTVEKKESIISIKQNASLTQFSYMVYAFPVESPNHGDRTLEISPWDEAGDASPLGWHNDGSNVSNHTKGNNVDAYEDNNNSNGPTGGNAARADGGANHEFDFSLDLNADPLTQQDPIITNLFYWNNIMHDVMYQYGFDEPGGNFQQVNQGEEGSASDYVYGEAQDNINGSGNNANFSTPPDGSNPRMQMYLWDPAGGDVLDVNAPSNVEGDYIMVLAAFGGDLDDPITGDVVEVDDGSGNPSLGCGALENGGAINGNIALVDRGSCEFGTKCLNAQNAGAVAVIVCNNVGGNPITMGGGANGNQVTIPAVMIRMDDCATIRQELENGLNVTMVDNPTPNLDSDLDNGVIVHEYGHGISNRLTGGPNTTSCLSNAEQMGEGWSDFFGLWITTQSSHQNDDPRGMGTYLLGEPIDGDGIRPTPYSTSFAINPSTYEDIHNNSLISQPHGIGYLWCTMIWDLNWALINAHGFDTDFYNSNGSAGNIITLQLVIDGLKTQPCSPGFVDGRNAILSADAVNNGGENTDIIWNVFARRGLGYSASQGSSSSRYDGSEAFDLPPGVPFMDEDELFENAPLPVELLAFNAIANDKERQIELYWNTASETDNKGFELQRKTDERGDFETISWVDGAGESTVTLNYSFNDSEVDVNTQYYYQLKQIDFDGSISYSNVVTASLNGLAEEVEVFPNPTDGISFVKLTDAFSGNISLKVFDAKGQLVDQQTFNSQGNAELEINFLNQPEGVYFIQIESQNKLVTKRILVRH